ncbi:MAG TPA: hypothetical protein VFA26_22555 [Gemmataceae bacterium]|nr:hypothetical protein [Gemmataceae bacterium]
MVERAAQRVNVGAGIDVVGVAELLGGGVNRRAHADALPGLAGVVDLVLQETGQAEVEQLDLPVRRQQQVGRLHVTVDQPPVVGVLQGQRRLVGIVGRQRGGHAALLPTAWGGSSLTAARRSRLVSWARWTAPMPPAPSLASS